MTEEEQLDDEGVNTRRGDTTMQTRQTASISRTKWLIDRSFNPAIAASGLRHTIIPLLPRQISTDFYCTSHFHI